MFNTAWALGKRCQAKRQRDQGLGRSVWLRCSKGAGSGVTTQLVVFSHIQEHPVNRLQQHQCVWKQRSCGSLWNMWKYHLKPYDTRHRWGSAPLQLCCRCWWITGDPASSTATAPSEKQEQTIYMFTTFCSTSGKKRRQGKICYSTFQLDLK